jgi:hypothetical protein
MIEATETVHTIWTLTTAEALTAWATVGTLVVAIFAAIIAIIGARIALQQIREAREQTRGAREIGWNADAQESYRSYLEVCVNNPSLASPKYQEIKKDAAELEKYGWFVAYLLSASEKILAVAVNEEEWISTIKLNIGYHREFLADKAAFFDADFWCYSKDLRNLIVKETGREFTKQSEVAWQNDHSASNMRDVGDDTAH